MIKKITATILALTIAFSMTACNESNISDTENPNTPIIVKEDLLPFDEFVDTLPAEFIGEESIDLNFLFLNPQNYGFEESLLRLPYMSDEEIKESNEDTQIILATLQQYDKTSLTNEQKLTYDVVQHYLNHVVALSKYDMIDRGYLGSFLGYQAQLPLLLNEFTFTVKNDLDSYFNILQTAGDTFLLYAEIEERKIEAGVGMPQLIIDKVIEQCDNFIKEEDNFLIESTNSKIDEMDFLSDEEKIESKEKNEKLIKEDFRDAYKNLGDALRKLDGRDNDYGLWSLENGKDYYEDLLQYFTGTDMTVKEIEMEAVDILQEYSMIMTKVFSENYDEISSFLNSNMIIKEFDTVEENIEFFGEMMEADFPSIGELNYTVTPVPKEMEENFSPAAYVLTQIDSPMNTPESIYINGEYDSNLYATIAHEGYPGHMYQNAYYKQHNAPAIRYIIDYPGYSEGWATYVENNSVKYSELSEPVQMIWKTNNIVSQMYYVLMDIDLHYNGLKREEFVEKYSTLFGSDPSSFENMYEIMLETPGNYSKYFFSALKFQQMYDETKEILGEHFSDIDFHEVLLASGSAPFNILQEQLDIYIDETLSNHPQISDDIDEEIEVEDEELSNVA